MFADTGLADVTEDSRPLALRREGSTLVATLNRPEARNALDVELMTSLKALWRDPDSLAGVRCIVVTGAGKGFCSGADVTLLETDRSDADDTAEGELAFLPGRVVEVPVIAAINGVCAGGGLHFVADADIVIAADTATFLDPHVSVGQVTALEPLTLRLQMRPDVLARMALIGRREKLDAAAAREAGLVSEVVAAEALMERALELAGWIGENSPEAVRRSRKVLRELEEGLLGDRLDAGWAEIREHWSHPDSKEGPKAFIERRGPRWPA
jgi:enoyl-CoA hydratase/carnithine racemase